MGNRIAVTHAKLGDLYLVANHPSEAIQHYRAALEIRPRFMDIRSKFAETLIELGELEQAKDELVLILESRPSFVGARVRLGVVQHRLGDDDRAVAEWKRCLEDDPTRHAGPRIPGVGRDVPGRRGRHGLSAGPFLPLRPYDAAVRSLR